MATPQQLNAITALYVGYFDRAPDPAGLQFWIDQLSAGREFNTIAADFAASPEAQALYPYLVTPGVSTPSAFITSVYMNMFNRAPDAAGLSFWTGVLSDGRVSVADMIEAIINGAQDGSVDKATLDNKVAVGFDFATEAGNVPGFTFDAAAKSAAIAALDGVTDDVATVAAAKAATDTYVAGAANPGDTFTLTTGVDALVGTAGNDTFNATETATSAVLGGLDNVDGGVGKDTLNIADTATAAAVQFSLPAGFTTTSVENLNVTTNGGINMNVSGIAGLEAIKTSAAGTTNTAVTAAGTTDVTTTVAGAATTTITGGKVVSATAGTGATTVTGKGLTSVVVNKGGAVTIDNLENTVAATTAKGTTLTEVTLNQVNAASAIKGEGLATLNVNGATAGANTVTITNAKVGHELTVNANGTGYDAIGAAQTTTVADAAAAAVTVNATGAKSNLSLAGSTVAKTVTITGDADLSLVPLASATKIDGSAATGALTLGALAAGTVNVSTGAGNDSFTLTAAVKATVATGAGNDVVTLGSAVAAGSNINLGAGDDKILVIAGGSVATDTAAAVTIIDGGEGTDSVSASLINAGNADQFLNFEGLDISAAANLDAELMTGSTIAALTLSGDAAANSTVTNVAAGVGLAVSGANTGVHTIGVKGATAGTTDSFAIIFDGAAAAAAPIAANVTAGTAILNGVETVTVASTGAANTWNSLTLQDDKLQTVTITGDKSLDLAFSAVTGTNTGVGAGGAVKMIDGSAATGKLNINTANVVADDKAGVGLTVKGGAANDTITLAQKATVDAGAGDDVITTSATGGTLTGGAGNDKFDVALAIATGTTEATSVLTSILDFTKGDKISFSAAATTFQAAKVDISAATNLDQALSIAVDTDGETSWFQYAGNTYVVAETDGAADGAFSMNDTVVKLAGIHDLSTSTFAGAELTFA